MAGVCVSLLLLMNRRHGNCWMLTGILTWCGIFSGKGYSVLLGQISGGNALTQSDPGIQVSCLRKRMR